MQEAVRSVLSSEPLVQNISVDNKTTTQPIDQVGGCDCQVAIEKKVVKINKLKWCLRQL